MTAIFVAQLLSGEGIGYYNNIDSIHRSIT